MKGGWWGGMQSGGRHMCASLTSNAFSQLIERVPLGV